MVECIFGKQPKISSGVFIHELAYVAGDVELSESVTILPTGSVRGDEGKIRLGKGCNVQEGAVVHGQAVLESYVTVGHGAMVHGAYIGEDTIIGMGAIVLDGAKIGAGCVIGAGSVIPMGKTIEAESVVVGNPYRILRKVSGDEREKNRENALSYMKLGQEYQNKREK